MSRVQLLSEVAFITRADWCYFLRETKRPPFSSKSIRRFLEHGGPIVGKKIIRQALNDTFADSLLRVNWGYVTRKRHQACHADMGEIEVTYCQRRLNPTRPLVPGESEEGNFSTVHMCYGPNGRVLMKAKDPVKFNNQDIYAGIRVGDPLSIEEGLTSELFFVRSLAVKLAQWRESNA